MDKPDGTLAGAEMPPAPPSPRPAARRVVAAPKRRADPDALLDDAREAMAHELRRLKSQAANGPLSPNEVRSLGMLADAACKLAREEREAAKADDLSDLPREKLIEEGRKALEELDQ